MHDRGVHLVEQLLVTRLLVLEIVVLVTGFFRLSDEDIAIAGVVENKLLDNIVSFENAFFVREFGNVRRRLGVQRSQLLVDVFFLLLLSQVLLVLAKLVCLHVE